MGHARKHVIPQFPGLKGSTTPPSAPMEEPSVAVTDVKPTAGKSGTIRHATRQFPKGSK